MFDLQNNLNNIAVRYNKDIIVVETAYPFTSDENDGLPNIIRFPILPGYPVTPEGQMKMLSDVMTTVRTVPNGHGLVSFTGTRPGQLFPAMARILPTQHQAAVGKIRYCSIMTTPSAHYEFIQPTVKG